MMSARPAIGRAAENDVYMQNLTFEALFDAEFRMYGGNPILRRHGFSTVVADPFVLTPDRTPDGRWKLFAHTLEGVFIYDSADGYGFGKGRKIVSRAMRPSVLKTEEGYILFYERVLPLLARGLTLVGGDWKSEIWAVKSRDLVHFSEPFPVLGYDRPYEQAGRRGHSLSNPFLIRDNGGYSLYYSAGLTFVPDCGFSEPTFVCLARSARPDADYKKADAPILRPDPEQPLFNLCSGCHKVYRLADGYAGIQNGIYRVGKRSESAINLLRSEDGVHFEFARTLVAPSRDGGWMSQFVYASHLVQAPDGSLRLYFNARDRADILGVEHIGVALAE